MVGGNDVDFFGDSVKFEDIAFEDDGYYLGKQGELDESFLSSESCGIFAEYMSGG
jgi:hypothetical protein